MHSLHAKGHQQQIRHRKQGDPVNNPDQEKQQYSLGVTITGEIISVLHAVTDTRKTITPNELTVVLHLLMKLESLMSEPSPSVKPASDDILMEDVNNNEISSEKLAEVSELLTKLLTKIAVEPHF